jgi:hypothetical protein
VGPDSAFSQQKTFVWDIQMVIYLLEVQFAHRAGRVICTLIAEQVI